MVAHLFGRLELLDVVKCFTVAYVLFFLLCGSTKYSVVFSIFVTVNLLVLYAYSAVEPAAPGTAFGRALKIGAHRGLAQDAPENTLGAFRQVTQFGADNVEFDIDFTSDGVAIVIHDNTVDRTTNGTGAISSLTLDVIRKLNAAAHFPDQTKFSNEQVPTLDEALKLLLSLNLRILIDVKATSTQGVTVLVEAFQKHKELYTMAAVCSFFPQVIYNIKRADPNIIVGHTWEPGFFSLQKGQPRFSNPLWHYAAVATDYVNEWLVHSWYYKVTGANLILAHRSVISEHYVSSWRNRGLEVVAWTVNDLQEKLYFKSTLNCAFLTDKLSDMPRNM